jgi:hypothetical protein
MARMSARQMTIRRRVEGLVRLAAPGLDLLLAAGEQLSRLSGTDPASREWSPRPLGDGGSRRVTRIGR